MIARAELVERRCRREVEHLVAAREDPRVAVARLRIAEVRVAQLQASRQVLIAGESAWDEDES